MNAFSLMVLLFQMILTFNVCIVSHILLWIPFGITLLLSQKKIVNVNACSEREIFQLEKQSALDKISELEKQLLDFQQKHAILQEELLDAKK